MLTPSRRSSSAFFFQIARRYRKFVSVDWRVPRSVAIRTLRFRSSSVSLGLATTSERLQKPLGRRSISPPLCSEGFVTPPPANLAAVYPYTDRTISSSYEAVHFGLLSPTPLHSSGIVSTPYHTFFTGSPSCDRSLCCSGLGSVLAVLAFHRIHTVFNPLGLTDLFQNHIRDLVAHC